MTREQLVRETAATVRSAMERADQAVRSAREALDAALDARRLLVEADASLHELANFTEFYPVDDADVENLIS